MNGRTAKLLWNSARIMSKIKSHRMGKKRVLKQNVRLIYGGLKNRWNKTPKSERNKIRKALKGMVKAYEAGND